MAKTNNAQALDEALNSKNVTGDFLAPTTDVWDDIFEDIKINDFSLQGGSFATSTFNNCLLTHVKFSESNLEYVTFNNCKFENVIFEECHLSGINFVNCEQKDFKIM